MDKSNTNSEEILDNNDENIKTIEKLPRIKISNLSIILYLHHCSEFIIRQYPNIKSYKYTVNIGYIIFCNLLCLICRNMSYYIIYYIQVLISALFWVQYGKYCPI